MSIQGKKIAMVKHTLSVAQSVLENLETNFNNPLLMELGLVHIKAKAQVKMDQLQSTPAERFNDGTLKPEDMTGKVVVAAGDGKPEKLRVILDDIFKESGFKVDDL